MTGRVLLVRHTHAGVRGTWPGDDLERKLSERGHRQAKALARDLADEGIGQVCSSRATRCLDSVTPLAQRLSLEVRTEPRLLEGTPAADALAWLESLGDTVTVACSHGDVIGGVLQRLAAHGTDLDGPLSWPKGAVWELAVDEALVVRGRFHAPPEA